MPSVESNALVTLFNELNDSKTSKSKSLLLSKAKEHVMNRMTDDELFSFFLIDSTNLADFLQHAQVWTPDLDACNGIVEYLEPYDIIERVFQLAKSLESFITPPFFDKSIFLLEQSHDEKVKHLLVKRLIQLISSSFL